MKIVAAVAIDMTLRSLLSVSIIPTEEKDVDNQMHRTRLHEGDGRELIRDMNAIMLAVPSQLVCGQIEGANVDRVCIEGLILSNVKSSSDQNIRHADSCIPFEARFSITSVRVTPPQLSSKIRLTMFPQCSLEGG